MITGYIKGQNLELRSPLVVADTINYMTAQFVFQTKDWDGCRKFSHWTCGDAGFTIPLVHDRIEEDAHLNLTAGTWTVWIHGERYENGTLIQRITTDQAILTVKPTGSAGEGPFPEIPATEVERINAEMDEIRENADALRGNADTLREDVDSLVEDSDALRKDSDALRKDSDALRKDSDALREDVDILQEDSDALRGDVDTLREDADTLHENVSQILKAIPKNTSDLTNDSGFITRLVADLANYYKKSETLTADEIRALVSAIPKFGISVVSSLPTSNISATTVYLVKSGNASGDLYTEYIYANGAWEVLGSQRVDLTGYATEEWVRAALEDDHSVVVVSAASDFDDVVEAVEAGKVCVYGNQSRFPLVQYINTSSRKEAWFRGESRFTGEITYYTLKADTGWTELKYTSITSYNLVKSLGAGASDAQAPSAKAVYDAILAYSGGGGAGGGGTAPAGTDLVGHAMISLMGASYDSLEVTSVTFPPDVTDDADQQRMLRAGAVKAIVTVFEGDEIAEAGVLDCISGNGFTFEFAGVMIGKNRTAFVAVTSIEDSNEYQAEVLAVHEGGGSSGGDAMRLKVLAELPYEGTPPIIDMIDFTRKYTFADIAEAYVAGRTVTMNTEYDLVPFQYGMFWLDHLSSHGIEFHGHYWRVPDVEADVDEGWVPAVAFLREDGTLTIEDREWSGYAKQAEVDSLSKAIEQLEQNGTGGSGLTVAQISALDGLFKIAAYTEDAKTAYKAFTDAFGITEDDSGGGTETPDVTTYTISLDLINVTSSNSATSVTEGASYTATLTAADGYELFTVTVTVGGVDVTATAYAGGVVTIASVTGNVEILASATVVDEKEPELIMDGLVDYFDFRNKVTTAGSGGLYYLNSDIGGGQMYSWYNFDFDEYGGKLGKHHNYSNNRSTGYPAPSNTLSGDVTICLFAKHIAYLCGLSTRTGEKPNAYIHNWSYKNADGELVSMGSAIVSVPSGYNCITFVFCGKVAKVYVNGVVYTELDCTDKDDFASHNIDWRLGTIDANHYVVAAAIYNRALTNVEITEIGAYLKTLEVTA